MSGTNPPPGSGPGEEQNPYAQSGQGQPPQQPWASGPPPSGPPAWSGPVDGGASAWGDPAPPTPADPPPPIRRAVMLMYVGAGLALISGVLGAIAPNDTGQQAELDIDESSARISVIVMTLIFVGLWVWMARSNQQGKSWARTVATVLGGLNILFALIGLLGGGVAIINSLINLVLAGYILYLLYRPESSAYYAAMSGKRR